MKKQKMKLGFACAFALGVFAASGADYPTTVTGLRPILYHRLNETAPVPLPDMATNSGTAGSVGNGYYLNGAIHPTTGALAGDSDAAANFPGAGAEIRVPYTPALSQSGPFTVEYWSKPIDAVTDMTACSFTDFGITGGSTTRKGWLFYNNTLADGQWSFRVYKANNSGVTITAGTVTTAWQHIVGVFDGTDVKLYVDGQQVASAPLGGTYVPPASAQVPFTIGRRSDTGFSYNGDLDEVVYYTNALTAGEILAHYQNGINATPATPYSTLVKSKNPAGYWRLNEPTWTDPGTYPTAVNNGTLGSANNGTYKLGTTTGMPGVSTPPFVAPNYAVGLNRMVSGNVDVPGPALVTSNCTFTGWVKRNGSQNGWSGLVFQRGTALATGPSFGDANELRMSWNDGEWGWVPSPALVIPDNVWTFFAAVVTSSNTTLYVNEKSATHTIAHGEHDFGLDPIKYGWDPANASRYVDGLMDEVAFFDYPLTPAQISQLYAAAQIPAFITTQPQAPVGIVYEGATVALNVEASGVPTLRYQWMKGDAAIAGKTGTNLTLANLTVADSGNYSVVVTNTYGSVTSSVVALSVVAGPPIVFTPPQSITKYAGARPSFKVVVGGSVPITYQWSHGATVLAGQTNSTLSLNAVQLADAGTYSVAVSNAYGGSVVSATLTVVTPSTSYAAGVMGLNPRAFWDLNETSGTVALDRAGSYDGTYVSFVTNNVPSVTSPTYAGYSPANTGYEFPGSRAYVEIPALGFTNNTFSIAFWAKPVSPQADGVPFMFTGGSSDGGFGVNLDGGPALRHHYANNGPSGWWQSSGLEVNWDTWNYIVVVIEPNQATFYLDKGDGNGLQSSVVPGTHVPMAFNLPCYISRESRDMRYFKGPMDEMALFDRALSPGEVASLHTTALAGSAAPLTVLASPASQTVLVSSTVSMSGAFSGGLPISYQWTKNGAPLPGATAATLVLSNVYYTDAANYAVTARNTANSANSTAATLTVQAPATFAYLTNDLVLHLKFDGNYADSSGNANDGSFVDLISPPFVPFVPGKLGNGVQVGTNGYLSVLSAPSLTFGPTDSFSVAFWVKCGPGNNDVPIIGNAVNSTYQDGWVFSENGNKIEWTLAGTTDNSSVIADPVPGSPTITDGVWHNVVASFDRAANTAVTYVDGVQVDTRSIAGLGSLDSGQSITLGNDPTGTYIWDLVNYQVDDVGIWRRALTPSEATGIFAAAQIGQSFDVKGPGSLTLQKSGGNLELIWQQGTLQSLDNLGGIWVDVVGAVAPYHVVTPNAAQKFYRVRF